MAAPILPPDRPRPAHRPRRTRLARGGLGRGFGAGLAVSLVLHGALAGVLAGTWFAPSSGPPPRTSVDTSVEPALVLEGDPVPVVSRPPGEEPPPSRPETLLEALEVPSDPRFAGDPEPRGGEMPVIGVAIPGGSGTRRLPRLRGSPGGGGTDGGSGAGGRESDAAPATAVPPPPPVFVFARPVPGSCPKPAYPARERERGVEGALRLRVVVGEDGAVRGVEVATSSGSVALDSAATDAVAGWRFTPATEDGTPVESVVFVPFNFHLTDR